MIVVLKLMFPEGFFVVNYFPFRTLSILLDRIFFRRANCVKKEGGGVTRILGVAPDFQDRSGADRHLGKENATECNHYVMIPSAGQS